MRPRFVVLVALGLATGAARADAALTVRGLRTEYRNNPLGVDIAAPRLSWVLDATASAQRQTAYRVLVASTAAKLAADQGDLWDSGKVASDRTLHVAYAGRALVANQRCHWKVRAWDAAGSPSAWSAPAQWSMGLLKPADWGEARWISHPRDAAVNAAGPLPATLLRTTFRIDGTVKRAVVHATGLGVYELRLNGRKVGDQVLAPEFTCYDRRIQVQSYDVTDQLVPGANGIGATLATGWNGEHFFGMAIKMAMNPFQGRRGFRMRLDIEREDGSTRTIVSHPAWRTTRDGPIRSASIYDGEVYDARLEWPGWDTGTFDDATWNQVVVADWIEQPRDAEGAPVAPPALRWQANEPIRVMHDLKPVAMTEPAPGVFILDMGQNMVGWCRIEVHGRQGTEIRVRHGEMLNEDGTLHVANLRRARQTDRYIKRTDQREIFEPRFTYHGFRYVEITGRTNIPWRYEPERKVYRPQPKHVTGRVVYSGAPATGTFACSSEHINRLMANVTWTQRGNMHSVPTDCPQRDERAGWMGDIQAFAQTAIFNMDMAAFLNKWLYDVRHSQHPDGRYPNFAPMDLERWAGGTPAWADAGVVVPWRLYQNYADTRLIEQHYDSARRWVDYVHGKNPNLLWERSRGSSFNDWLNADQIKAEGWPTQGGEVPPKLLATAFFAHSAELVSRMATVTGREDDALKYARLAAGIKAAFNKRYVKPDGTIEGNTQAGYALALDVELLPPDVRAKAARHMVEGFTRYNGHLSTGIQTTHRLMKALSNHGYHDEAYRLLNLTSFPSWGFMLENGATTIWERWDGYVEGRGFQAAMMNSFNHWAFGAVGEWVWRHVVGLHPDEAHPGWKHFTIAPRPGGGLTWAKGEYASVRGTIKSHWRIEDGAFLLDVTIPPNTTAAVLLPEGVTGSVTVDGRPVSASATTPPTFNVASGSYRFAARYED